MSTTTTATLARFTLDTAVLRRDQGLISMDQYRAFLYVWHADPTKVCSAPMKHRPHGVPAELIDELLSLTGIDEHEKLAAWTDEDRAVLVREQQEILAAAERQNA